MKTISFSLVVMALMFAGCGTPVPTPVPTSTPIPSIVLAGGYRPPQQNDLIEGAKIGYHYVVPSDNNPVGVLAFGNGMIQLMSIKMELSNGLVAYLQDIAKENKPVLAFDEKDPSQKDAKVLSWDPKKPIEIIFIKLPDNSPSLWSVRETEDGELRTAYKFVIRKDGGLRFIDGYDLTTLNSLNQLLTLNGGGTGLGLSSRLALLRTIINTPAYQNGVNVMNTTPPTVSQYDARILKIDPTQKGLAQDLDWVIISRPGPGGGIPISP
ncbi:MAG: hypothetical protein HZB51_34425 [Chloroflexi bacterium]|nr:hypothetical protein [Chloroflexota bacterium]